MAHYDASLQLSKIPLSFASFWFRIYDLPLGGTNAHAVCKIVEIVGYVEEVDLNENSPGWGEFVRVTISLDITKHLP